MAHIEMLCPHCGHQLRIPTSFGGTRAGCIHCKGRFVVPDAPMVDIGPPGDHFTPMSPSTLEQMDIDGGGDPPSLGGVGGPKGGMSLSALERLDIDGADLSPAFAHPAHAGPAQAVSAADELGCLFWGLAFHLPPVALVWALFLPKGHSQKAVGLGVSAGFLLLAIVVMLVFT